MVFSRPLLAKYAACKDSAEVVQVQNEYLKMIEEEHTQQHNPKGQKRNGTVFALICSFLLDCEPAYFSKLCLTTVWIQFPPIDHKDAGEGEDEDEEDLLIRNPNHIGREIEDEDDIESESENENENESENASDDEDNEDDEEEEEEEQDEDEKKTGSDNKGTDEVTHDVETSRKKMEGMKV